jgi:hypothetical protein
LTSRQRRGGSEVCNLHTDMSKIALFVRTAKNLAGKTETWL